MYRYLSLSGIILALVLVGCRKHVEAIAVFPDGSAMFVTHASDIVNTEPGDTESAEPLPAQVNGWRLTEQKKTNPEGQEILVQTAYKEIGPGKVSPNSYAPPNAQDKEIFLSFPTEIRIEQRDDGKYYHFRRIYRKRDWAKIDNLRQGFDEEIKKLVEKQPEQLTTEERLTLTRLLARRRAIEVLSFFDEAIATTGFQVSQYLYLTIRDKLRIIFEDEELIEEYAKCLFENGNGEKGKVLEEESNSRINNTIRKGLLEGGVSAAMTEEVLASYRKAVRTWKITDELSDDNWELTVVLPGKIIAHNSANSPQNPQFPEPKEDTTPDLAPLARKLDASKAEYSSILFEFKGEALHDRDVVLMATSVVRD